MNLCRDSNDNNVFLTSPISFISIGRLSTSVWLQACTKFTSDVLNVDHFPLVICFCHFTLSPPFHLPIKYEHMDQACMQLTSDILDLCRDSKDDDVFLTSPISPFSDAFSNLYKKVCPSVRPSVVPSVGPSVRHTRVELLRNGPKLNKIAPRIRQYAI